MGMTDQQDVSVRKGGWVSSRNVWNSVQIAQQKHQQAEAAVASPRRAKLSKQASALCSDCKSFFHSTWDAVVEDPKILFIPLLWLAISLSLGVWAVHASSVSEVNKVRSEIEFDMGQQVVGLQQQLQQAVYPNQALQMFVRVNPNTTDIIQPSV